MKSWSERDMSTFSGRLLHFFSVTAPYRSFYASQTVRQYNNDVKTLYKERAEADGNAMLT